MQQVRINSRGLAYIDPYTLVGEKKGDVYTFHIEVHIQFKKKKDYHDKNQSLQL